MQSLEKMPMELIETLTNDLADALWNLSPNKCRHLAAAIEGFQYATRNFIISELYASSIVEQSEDL